MHSILPLEIQLNMVLAKSTSMDVNCHISLIVVGFFWHHLELHRNLFIHNLHNRPVCKMGLESGNNVAYISE